MLIKKIIIFFCFIKLIYKNIKNKNIYKFLIDILKLKNFKLIIQIFIMHFSIYFLIEDSFSFCEEKKDLLLDKSEISNDLIEKQKDFEKKINKIVFIILYFIFSGIIIFYGIPYLIDYIWSYFFNYENDYDNNDNNLNFDIKNNNKINQNNNYKQYNIESVNFKKIQKDCITNKKLNQLKLNFTDDELKKAHKQLTMSKEEFKKKTGFNTPFYRIPVITWTNIPVPKYFKGCGYQKSIKFFKPKIYEELFKNPKIFSEKDYEEIYIKHNIKLAKLVVQERKNKYNISIKEASEIARNIFETKKKLEEDKKTFKISQNFIKKYIDNYNLSSTKKQNI